MKIINKHKKLKLKEKVLKSNIIFDCLIAKQYHDTRYYAAMGSEIKALPLKAARKNRFSTSHKKRVSVFLREYKNLFDQNSQV